MLGLNCALDKSLIKYWYQRYSLFSKYDEGIQMDTEGWYSVTPEEIARHVAARMYQRLGPNSSIIDAMVGVGGNTIQFASVFPLVFGIEMDPKRVCSILSSCSLLIIFSY